MSNIVTNLMPGVVTGDDYITLINACQKGRYALPAVNVTSSSTANAVLEAAARNESDVILQVSNGGAQFYAGKGLRNEFEAKVLGAVAFAQHVNLMAEAYGVCAVLHTDHADKSLIPWVDRLITCSEEHFEKTGKPLFSSHMLDLSAEELDYNLDQSARVLKRMQPLGMSLEIELGVTGGEEDGVDNTDVDNSKLYTQPEDVLLAYKELALIGHFTTAAAFGNVHGVYKPGNVVLRPEILKSSQIAVAQYLVENSDKAMRGTFDKSLPLPFVFHGGSGSEPAKIKEALTYGVVKMNIDTDTQFAYAEPVGQYVSKNPRAFEVQIEEDGTPYKKQYDPRKWVREAEKGMSARLDDAFEVLGSKGQSLATLDL